MIGKRSLLILILLIGIVVPLAGNDKSVVQIQLVFNKSSQGSFDEMAIKKRLKTKVNDIFSQTKFDEDLKMLAVEFSRIDPEVTELNNEVFITIKLYPKPVVGKIIWEGNKKVKSKRLQKELDIAVGSVFSRDNFLRAFHKLKRYYVKKGYFETEIDYELIEDPSANFIDIKVIINEGRSGHISKIIFKGVTGKEEGKLIDLMATKKYNIFTSWLNNDGIFSDELLERDEYVILSMLQNAGYANARVKMKIIDVKEEDHVIVEVSINKGPMFYCKEITFDGNTVFASDQIDKLFIIRPNMPYSPETIQESVHNIANMYGKYGYIDCNVNYKVTLANDENAYHIHVHIDEGKQYRVGLIKVFGNKSTQTNVILHECLLSPGDIFNMRKLAKTEERLYNVGYFKSINIYAVQDDKHHLGPNYRDVHIEVEETSTGSLGFFFGFSTLSSVFGGIELGERNFNYKGLVNIFSEGLKAIRGGGENAKLRLNFGKKEQSYVVSWTKPYFLDTNWSIGFDLDRSVNKTQSDDYDIKASGAQLFAHYRFNDFLGFGWHYRLRNSDVNVKGKMPDLLIKESRNDGVVSATGVSLFYDSTDKPRDPTAGFRSSLEFEYAGLGGHYDFWSVGYFNSYYFPICKKGTLKYRAEVRFVIPTGHTSYEQLPIDERLFLGGETTVRGYRPYIIGPKFSNGDPRGGLSSLLVSLEYMHRLFERLDGFVFIDAGEVTKKQFHLASFKSSYGCGIRLHVMGNVPVTIGMGFPIKISNKSNVKRFYLSLGGIF